FTQLGTGLAPNTQRQLDRGYRTVELLEQPQYQHLTVAEQGVRSCPGTRGYLDKIPVGDSQRWETEFLQYMRDRHGDVLGTITSTGDFAGDTEATLQKAITDFNQAFKPSTV